MRIIKETQTDGIKITCFQLEHNFLVKYEQGPQELTYKFKMGEQLENVNDLSKLIEDHLTEAAIPVLQQMHHSRLSVIDQYFKSDETFEEFI